MYLARSTTLLTTIEMFIDEIDTETTLIFIGRKWSKKTTAYILYKYQRAS